jgi:diamine N-acetyltransferase
MILIEEVTTDDQLSIVKSIAEQTWPSAYGAILTQAQLEYMMEMMYSKTSLQTQRDSMHHFILAIQNGVALGFASFEFHCGGVPKTKVHKIYILPNAQGKGIGNILIDFIINEAKLMQQEALFLNVNRNNPAQHFYSKLGFFIAKEEVIDIGNGYVMDDYVMEKPIK